MESISAISFKSSYAISVLLAIIAIGFISSPEVATAGSPQDRVDPELQILEYFLMYNEDFGCDGPLGEPGNRFIEGCACNPGHVCDAYIDAFNDASDAEAWYLEKKRISQLSFPIIREYYTRGYRGFYAYNEEYPYARCVRYILAKQWVISAVSTDDTHFYCSIFIGDEILGAAIDLGYLAEITPDPTETPTPTVPPTWTSTPTATPAETPTPDLRPTWTPEPCTSTGPEILMSSDHFNSGDEFYCEITLCNAMSSPLLDHPLFVILEVNGYYFFAPAFEEFGYYSMTFEPGTTRIPVIDPFQWPENSLPLTTATWYSAIMDPGFTVIIGTIDSHSFTFGESYK